MTVGALTESGHAMPEDARGALAGALALAGTPEARSAAVLFLLDPNSTVRRAVAGALAQGAASLTPTEVRRLIAMRNWRPENERAEVDAMIRKARAAGIDCAPWEAGSVEAIVATTVDGAATQGFLLISPVGRKKRISSVLTKGGIADAWSGEQKPRHCPGLFVVWSDDKVSTMGQRQKLNAAFKAGDQDKICAAIFAMIVETGSVTAFARKAGLDRTMLYSAFKRNPRFDNVLKVMRAADFKLVVVNHPAPRSKASAQMGNAFDANEVTLIVKALGDALRARKLTHDKIIRPPHIPRLRSRLLSRRWACDWQ